MKRVLSGITPSGSGQLHIANYFGAVANFVKFQEEAECIYFIADLHALTTIHDREALAHNVHNIALDYLSLGVDPEKAIFFRQSDVYPHPYLESILTNFTSVGFMKRAHAYKDKLQKDISEDDVNMGLFSYPILMAADILLYKPDLVPVGKDQKQHIEITRDIAERFNYETKSDVLKLPDPYIPEETAVIVGTDGQRKMSKSLGNIIGIFEDKETIRKQIMATVTDPNRIHATDPGKVEGNVIFTYHDLMNRNEEEVADLKERYRKGTVGDVEVKNKLFAAHQDFFAQSFERRKKYERNPKLVEEILQEGAKKALKIAEQTLQEVKIAVGL